MGSPPEHDTIKASKVSLLCALQAWAPLWRPTEAPAALTACYPPPLALRTGWAAAPPWCLATSPSCTTSMALTCSAAVSSMAPACGGVCESHKIRVGQQRPCLVQLLLQAGPVIGRALSPRTAGMPDRGPCIGKPCSVPMHISFPLFCLISAGEMRPPLTVVLINNGGGGIFSFLPIADAVPEDVFTPLWATPQHVDLAGVAGAAFLSCFPVCRLICCMRLMHAGAPPAFPSLAADNGLLVPCAVLVYQRMRALEANLSKGPDILWFLAPLASLATSL
jgi:hypothetical protein